jgi:hypothetical protein
MTTAAVTIAREYLRARVESNTSVAIGIADIEAIKVLLAEQHRLNQAIAAAAADKRNAVEAYNALRDRRKKGSHGGAAKRNKPRGKGSHPRAASPAKTVAGTGRKQVRP